MIDVLYDGWGKDNTSFDTMRMLAPEPERTLGKAAVRGEYLKCVAVQDFHVNTFTVYSPFSARFKFDREANKIDAYGDNVINTARFTENGVEIQLFPQYVFRTTESVVIQLLPPLLTPPRSDAFVTPGEYDISRWLRPLNTSFMIPDGVTEFEIKEGEPLYSVRFITPNNEPVKLVRRALENEEIKLANACTNVTYVKLGLSLNSLYALYDNFKASFKKSKCPFHRK